MAEKIGKVNGKHFITAIALGADLISRMRLAPKLKSSSTGWSANTYAPFGTATVAAKILGLDEQRLWNAMGLAFSQAAGSLQSIVDGSLAVRLDHGLGARAGAVSVLLAQMGLTGSRNILEGRYGFYPLYFHNDYDASRLTKDLGKRFEGTYVSVKPFPSCKLNHAPIEAVLSIVAQHAIEPKDINQIVVGVNQYAYNLCCVPRESKIVPQTIVDAQFSIPYTVAVAVVKRDLFIHDFTLDAIKDTSVLRIANKVIPMVDPELDKMGLTVAPATVEIRTVGNDKYSKRIDYVKGHPKNPMTFQDCANKLRRCASFSALPLEKTT
jgi:2-methylcitrate dehydratase PrpD